MPDAHAVIEMALNEVERLSKVLAKQKSAQVRGADERQLVKATALAWFNQHRSMLIDAQVDELLVSIDGNYRSLLEGAEKLSSRLKLRQTCKGLKTALVCLRSDVVGGRKPPAPTLISSSEALPAFGRLVSDGKMQQILERRWAECGKCIQADAPLAATVMMGGLVEALLLARINRETDKKAVFTAKTAPKGDDGKPLQLKEWTLKHYLDVLHEVGWIGSSAKDVGAVLRDYRNYIHQNKEYSHGINLALGDARLFWEITKAICRELLAS
jgi:hypothetical protein